MSERRIHLISDLHLDQRRPETTRLLIDYLNGPARRAHSLFILGDLFEVWIGDDAMDPTAEALLPHFQNLADSGTELYFMAGNRDFLVGEDYCRRARLQRIEEPLILEGVEPPTLLMHGDILCTDDTEYQRFRRRVRNPDWQSAMLRRPLWWRRLLAGLARRLSRWRNRNKPEQIMDVNTEAVQTCFRQHGVTRIIHGHTHRPAVHRLNVDGLKRERIVLGDWHPETGSLVEIQGALAQLKPINRSELDTAQA